MRILVFSQAAWNTANSFGNTVTNWFNSWNDTLFFHFYARQQKPNTTIVEKYYHVSAVEILKKSFRCKQVGSILNPDDVVESEAVEDTNAEQKQIAKLHKKSNDFLYWGMEKVWRSERWINKTFDEFIEEADPDIIFAFATSPYILQPAIKHIKEKKSSVKVVLWVADDILSGFEQTAWYRRSYLKKGIEYCFNVADKLYGASVELCEKYSRIYDKKVIPLYKECACDRPIKEKNNSPVRLVYAGNLLYGRLETLKEIIKALKVINTEDCKAVLEIYSNTPIDGSEKQQWFDNKDALYMGVRPYEEIKAILNEADIVLHVESFEKEQIEAVKYSFSTKIIDCLQSGSVVVGIGPSHIASIEYIRKVKGAIVIDDQRKIIEMIDKLVSGNENLLDRAKSTREYVVKSHDFGCVRQKLHDELYDLIEHAQRLAEG